MRKRFVVMVWLGLLALVSGFTQAQSAPRIVVSWSTTGNNGGALNISVTNLPPGAGVEVEVKDVSHGNQMENPVGNPPRYADEKGEWPGVKAGSKTGYPDTAKDGGGTKYVVSVKVNGKTGPAKEIFKPGDKKRSFWTILGTLGTLYLTDAVGLTSMQAGPGPRSRPGVEMMAV